WVCSINPYLRLKMDIFPIIVHGIPTSFNPNNTSHIQKLMDENTGVLDTLQRVLWANQKALDGTKTHSSLIIHLTDPKAANYAIRNRVSYGDLKRTERSYRRILQCHKCQDFGHFFSACTNSAACTHCTGEHPFEDCDRRGDPVTCVNCL
ncbi:hypothetical protein CROQUDRAFT_20307, partial [Cronartium quercuum f. sp. fusiforme G11]